MQIKIKQNKHNVLLHRKEVQGSIEFEGATPSNNDLREALAKETKAAPEQVVVRGIHTAFSRQHAEFEASVYDSMEAKVKIEKLTPQEKKRAAEAKKAAAAGGQ